ncbi:hypothetical protein BLOT_008709 [Blomia tropicalis]|nr:hypothetical protein BLOT_008709 [Blomia tropicalis]
MVWAMIGNLEPMNLYFILNVLTGQMILMFGIHLVMAMYGQRIHKPSNLMIHHMVYDKHMNGNDYQRARLRLALCIFAIHTNQKYGFTYGSFGLVTINTLVKFTMFYAKFIMIAFKMYKFTQTHPNLTDHE